jgi:hypothetical protein
MSRFQKNNSGTSELLRWQDKSKWPYAQRDQVLRPVSLAILDGQALVEFYGHRSTIPAPQALNLSKEKAWAAERGDDEESPTPHLLMGLLSE